MRLCYVDYFTTLLVADSVCRLLFATYLLVLLFYIEDGHSKFLRNVGEVPDYMALYIRR
jgi:hypothetical protein